MTGNSSADKMDLEAPLNKTQHYEAVRTALLEVKPQWRNIGLALGIPVWKFNEFTGSVEEKMDKMLEVWLDCDFVTPTWGALVAALKNPNVLGGKPVAGKIKAKYIGGEESVGEDSNASGQKSSSSSSSGSQHASSQNPSLSEGVDSYRLREFPYLLGNSDDEIEDTICRLVAETDEMKRKFSQLVNRTSSSLKKQTVSPEDLALCVLSLGVFVPHQPNTSLVDDDKKEIEHSPSIARTFLILLNYITFTNYTVLEHIIEVLGTQEDKANLRNYETNFEQFCKRSAFKIPSTAFDGESSATNGNTFVVKLQESPTGSDSLDYCLRIKRKFACILEVNPSALTLRSVKEGCIELTFSLPEHVAKKVLPPSRAQREELWKASVQKLVYEGEEYPCMPPAVISKTDDSQSQQSRLKGKEKAGLQSGGSSGISAIDGTSQVDDIPSTSHLESYSQDEKVPWKEKYSTYKDAYEHKQTATDPIIREVKHIIEDKVLGQSEVFILSIGRYLKTVFPRMKEEESGSVLASMKSKPQFAMAQKILEMCGREDQTDPCEFLPLMVVCSRGVHELHTVLVDLRQVLHPDGWLKLTDLLYCLATLFFALWNHPAKKYLPPRFHYYMYYSLMIMENQSGNSFAHLCQGVQMISVATQTEPGVNTSIESGVADSGIESDSDNDQYDLEERASKERDYDSPGPSKKKVSAAQFKLRSTVVSEQKRKRKWQSPKLELTPEQEKIVNYPLKSGEMIRVMALAGTGKTSTLVKFAEARPDWKFLYCSFNRSIKKDAKKKFPDNVTAKTIHSLAFNALCVEERFKKKFKKLSLNPCDIEQHTSKPYFVLETLKNFIASDSETLSEDHIPKHASDKLLRDAAVIWGKMIDPMDETVKITHDGYLKLFQLQKPIFVGYDCILIDEAQDLTPAQISILMHQSCSKVFVGDDHQQIYSFRGAVNALDRVEEQVSETLHLTQSFRFGPEIAYVVSCILDDLKHERRRTILGGLQSSGVDGEQEGQMAIVSWKNKTLFDEMVNVCKTNPPSVKIGFAGGLESYGLDLLLDVYYLMTGRKDKIQDKNLNKFHNFKELEEHVSETRDNDLSWRIQTCAQYGDEIPHIVEDIRKRTTTKTDSAKIVFSTGHKAKGLEFDTVKMTGDFLEGERQSQSTDHKNLVYVATTRAMKKLIMPHCVVEVLHNAGEDFIFPVPHSEWLDQVQLGPQSLVHFITPPELTSSIFVDSSLPDIRCVICLEKKPTPALQFEKQQLKLADGNVIPGGIICEDCLGKHLSFMEPILKMAHQKK